jgi:hypothetical protein
VANPPTAVMTILADNPIEAFDYAVARVQGALRAVGVTDARCDLIAVSPDGRPS